LAPLNVVIKTALLPFECLMTPAMMLWNALSFCDAGAIPGSCIHALICTRQENVSHL
jgi:hypothetical protein